MGTKYEYQKVAVDRLKPETVSFKPKDTDNKTYFLHQLIVSGSGSIKATLTLDGKTILTAFDQNTIDITLDLPPIFTEIEVQVTVTEMNHDVYVTLATSHRTMTGIEVL